MSKQTAVEWLYQQLPDHFRLSKNGFDLLQQALEMERQQIIEAYCEGDGFHNVDTPDMAKEYYNQTYGKETTK